MERRAIPDENESATPEPFQPFSNVWSSAKGKKRLRCRLTYTWMSGTSGRDGKRIYPLIAWRNLKTLLLCLSSNN